MFVPSELVCLLFSVLFGWITHLKRDRRISWILFFFVCVKNKTCVMRNLFSFSSSRAPYRENLAWVIIFIIKCQFEMQLLGFKAADIALDLFVNNCMKGKGSSPVSFGIGWFCPIPLKFWSIRWFCLNFESSTSMYSVFFFDRSVEVT